MLNKWGGDPALLHQMASLDAAVDPENESELALFYSYFSIEEV